MLLFVDRYGSESVFSFLERLESKVVADWLLQASPTMRLSYTHDILKAIKKAKSAQDVISNDKLFGYDRDALRRELDGPIYGRSYCRYIMLRLEYLLQDPSLYFAQFNRISVEHVLPQGPGDSSKWVRLFDERARADWTHRLANLVLLGRNKNASLGNRDFDEKKNVYFKSSVNVFPNVVKVMQYAEWTPTVLSRRQEEFLSLLMRGFK